MKKGDCTISVAKTKVLISYAVTMQADGADMRLCFCICKKFSHDMSHLIFKPEHKKPTKMNVSPNKGSTHHWPSLDLIHEGLPDSRQSVHMNL